MVDLTKCYVSKAGNVVTPKGRMLYPALYQMQTPKGETDQSKARYQITLLLGSDVDLTLLNQRVNDAIAEKWGADATKKFKIKKPFLKTEEQGRLSDLAVEFPVMIRAANKTKPDVVFANGSKCDDDNETYGGRWARISLRPFCYDHPTGGKGVSLSLENVQLLDHDDRLGGGRAKAEDEFAPVEVAKTGSAATADSVFD
jgi:hypothetical protein